MAAQAFTGVGKPLVHALPTCDLMAQFATRCGAELRPFSLTKSYAHDLDSMAAAARDARAGLVYLCNPNSPTGTLTRRADIEGFLSALPPTVFVVVDEVHHDYVPRTVETLSFLDRRVDDDRVIVVRSFSALYGLAGLRVGYGVTTQGTAKRLEEHTLTRNLTVVGARAALAALEDTGYVEDCIRRNRDERQEFFNQVHARMLRVIDSQTNFVMLDVQERSAKVVTDHFMRHRIALPSSYPPFDRHIRVTLGSRNDMREFWRVWDLMPGLGAHSM